MSKSNKDINKLLASTTKLASYNMVLQLLFRALTFVLNAFILRHITKETLGIVNVRLLLLYSTVLFVSREAFRRACLSTNREDIQVKSTSNLLRWTYTINLLWCMIPVGVVCNFVATYCWINLLENPDPSITPHYALSVYVFGMCAWFELFAEPLWVIAQYFLFIKLKVISEGLAIFVKCITTALLVLYFPQWGLISFCIAQAAFTFCYIGIFYGYFSWFVLTDKFKEIDDFPFRRIKDFFPCVHKHGKFINVNSAKLTFSFFKQSILKQFLTEGERYVMTILNVLSFADQGVYDVINNLGSLVARFIFLPIEESFYLFFAQTLKRGENFVKQPQIEIERVSEVLFCLLRLVVLIASVILAFGLPYSQLLLDLYGGATLSSGTGPILLKFYCLYVLTIAINGTTECFVFAAMSQQQVDKYNKKMLLFSFIFLLSSFYLTKSIGSVGFILANCFNMGARIIHSIWFITTSYKGVNGVTSPLYGMVPDKIVVVSLLTSSFICQLSEAYFCCSTAWTWKFAHFSIGALCFLACAIVVWRTERAVVIFLQKHFLKKSTD